MRKTHPLIQVSLALAQDPDTRHWGTELQKRAGVRSGVMYPLLQRMLDEGWLADGWEDAELARSRKRPPRRYYEVTDAGRVGLGALLEAARADARFSALFATETTETGER